VDVGVHQDGLVHISAMSNKFVSDPREVVKSGQVVKVKVLEADPERKRISLTLRLDDDAAPAAGREPGAPRGNPGNRGGRPAAARTPKNERTEARRGSGQAPANTAMAEALRRAGLGK
jgi:uncharacterized protein